MRFNDAMKSIRNILALWIVVTTPLLAQTSEHVPQLADALKRYPAADANKDGVLTLEEALDYKAKFDKKNNRSNAAKAPKDGEKHIYKKVGDVELPLYVFQPEGHTADQSAPAIVFFFGGGWMTGHPTQFEDQCKHLASRGMVAITVEYRVISRHQNKVDDCIEDAKSAMRWVRGHAKKLGIDPNRIASAGGSAGGHLAACVELLEGHNAATDDLKVSPKPNAMVLFNPAMGFKDEKSYAPIKQRVRAKVEDLMPLTYADQKQPPCIMLFGTEDPLLDGAEAFLEISKKAGNDCSIVTYKGQGHSFFNKRKNDAMYYNLTLADVDKFLVDLGWLAKK